MLDKYNLNIAASYGPVLPEEWLPHILAQCKAKNKDFDADSFTNRSESYIKITYWLFDLIDQAIKIRDNENRTDNEIEQWCEQAHHLYKYVVSPFSALEEWAEDAFKDSYSRDERTTIFHISDVLCGTFYNVFQSMVDKLPTPRKYQHGFLKNCEFVANLLEVPWTNICNLGKRIVALEDMLKSLRSIHVEALSTPDCTHKILALEHCEKCMLVVKNAIMQLTEKMCA